MLIAPRPRAIFFALLISAVLLMGSSLAVLRAQSTWSPAEILWQATPGMGLYINNATHLVTDPAGAVHLAWLNFPKDAGNNSDQVAIYYSRWDGRDWTTPVDVFAATSAQPLGAPVLLPTEDGRVHILWISNSRLMRSSAWADDSVRPQAWTSPVAAADFSRPVRASFDATVDAQGVFHAVVVENMGKAYYLRSEDQGATWSEPGQLSSLGPDTASFLPQLAVAPDGRIHVVWSEVTAEDYGQRLGGVYYAFSYDDGATWSEPVEFAGPGHSDANVAVFKGDQVYVAWNAGTSTSGGRYLKYSNDGGVTWSDSLKFSERAGLSNYPSIALDSVGILHLMTGDGEYVMWDGATFTPAEPLSPVSIQTERCRLAISSGNVLVAVFPPDDGIVYSAVRRLDVPAIPTRKPAARPEETDQRAAIQTPEVTATKPTAVPTEPGATPDTPPSGNMARPLSVVSGSTSPVLLGVASAVMVILVAVVLTLWRRKR